jgi:hypothetical protein
MDKQLTRIETRLPAPQDTERSEHHSIQRELLQATAAEQWTNVWASDISRLRQEAQSLIKTANALPGSSKLRHDVGGLVGDINQCTNDFWAAEQTARDRFRQLTGNAGSISITHPPENWSEVRDHMYSHAQSAEVTLRRCSAMQNQLLALGGHVQAQLENRARSLGAVARVSLVISIIISAIASIFAIAGKVVEVQEKLETRSKNANAEAED